jgi:hypothetical protein
MVWPDKDGNDPRGAGKPPLKQQEQPNFAQLMMGQAATQQTTGERMGLYKKGLTTQQN